MRGFFSGGNDFAKEAVRTGEILSKYAKNPDPDAIAACVLMDGMIIPYKPETFEQTVSVQAAEYMRSFHSMNIKKPVYRTEGERQIFLAHSIIGLEGIRKEITDKKVYKYQDIKTKLDLNEINILAVIPDTLEQGLVHAALSSLLTARTALEYLVRTTQEALLFEKTGLPEHPVIRGAYELIRATEIKVDPLFTNRAELGLGIAKVLIETGLSSDPDVIGAAILNQYWAKKPGVLTQKFSARLEGIYRESSPFVSTSQKKESSDESRIISVATRVYLLESLQLDYLEYKKVPADVFDKYKAIRLLEDIESYSKSLENTAQSEPHAGLKARMEKAVAAANSLMRAPENRRIRKPGSPSMAWD